MLSSLDTIFQESSETQIKESEISKSGEREGQFDGKLIEITRLSPKWARSSTVTTRAI